MYTATLRCGTVLSYEARNLVPATDEVVPCRRHGYCTVDGDAGTSGRGRSRHRAAPRVQAELLGWLSRRPVTTVQALRRHRFTLRLIVGAHREGHLDVDLDTGRVALRVPPAPRP
jgi:hypothetical protein